MLGMVPEKLPGIQHKRLITSVFFDKSACSPEMAVVPAQWVLLEMKDISAQAVILLTYRYRM
jgi:hypothetical protein